MNDHDATHDFYERAAIREFCGNQSRTDAEAGAREDMLKRAVEFVRKRSTRADRLDAIEMYEARDPELYAGLRAAVRAAFERGGR